MIYSPVSIPMSQLRNPDNTYVRLALLEKSLQSSQVADISLSYVYFPIPISKTEARSITYRFAASILHPYRIIRNGVPDQVQWPNLFPEKITDVFPGSVIWIALPLELVDVDKEIGNWDETMTDRFLLEYYDDLAPANAPIVNSNPTGRVPHLNAPFHTTGKSRSWFELHGSLILTNGRNHDFGHQTLLGFRFSHMQHRIIWNRSSGFDAYRKGNMWERSHPVRYNPALVAPSHHILTLLGWNQLNSGAMKVHRYP